jgi:hypothetical protein
MRHEELETSESLWMHNQDSTQGSVEVCLQQVRSLSTRAITGEVRRVISH